MRWLHFYVHTHIRSVNVACGEAPVMAPNMKSNQFHNKGRSSHYKQNHVHPLIPFPSNREQLRKAEWVADSRDKRHHCSKCLSFGIC